MGKCKNEEVLSDVELCQVLIKLRFHTFNYPWTRALFSTLRLPKRRVRGKKHCPEGLRNVRIQQQPLQEAGGGGALRICREVALGLAGGDVHRGGQRVAAARSGEPDEP